MTQFDDQSDCERHFHYFNSRLVNPQEFNKLFNRVYAELKLVHSEVSAVNSQIEHIEVELNGKIDTILRHITRQN